MTDVTSVTAKLNRSKLWRTYWGVIRPRQRVLRPHCLHYWPINVLKKIKIERLLLWYFYVQGTTAIWHCATFLVLINCQSQSYTAKGGVGMRGGEREHSNVLWEENLTWVNWVKRRRKKCWMTISFRDVLRELIVNVSCAEDFLSAADVEVTGNWADGTQEQQPSARHGQNCPVWGRASVTHTIKSCLECCFEAIIISWKLICPWCICSEKYSQIFGR